MSKQHPASDLTEQDFHLLKRLVRESKYNDASVSVRIHSRELVDRLETFVAHELLRRHAKQVAAKLAAR